MVDQSQRSGWGKRLVLGMTVVALGWSMGAVAARDLPAGAMPTVALSVLPVQAKRTHQLILSGGPFPYAKDGTVFGNRERLLPAHPRGHYREYTVRTPGARNRGARRLVCGGEVPTRPQACFYTEDHYASFRQVLTN
jgi:ribonuclease T1